MNNKRVLVTGASGGIGESIAHAFHRAGAQVLLAGTRLEKLEALREQLGDRAYAAAVPLTEEGAADRLLQKATETLGGVDILVNNAGMTKDTLLMRMKDEDWDRVLDLNLKSVMRLCRAFMKPMMKERWGRIVNISSVVAATGNPGQCNYVASKAGLEGFSRALALEVATRGITVNCVAPGFIATAMTAGLPEAHKEKLLAQIPLGRMGKPEDIAAGVCFLASEAAGYITGCTLPINGGMWRN